MEIIAVDPDVDFSGVAKFDTNTKAISTTKMSFTTLIDYISRTRIYIKKLIIEGGWLNEKPNFHGGNYGTAQKIAYSVGRNAQTGILLAEFADFYKIPKSIVKPLRKVWRNGKISQEELNTQLRGRGYTPLKKTNQDERDSILLLLYGI